MADYLAAHFAMFAILTVIGLWLAQQRTMSRRAALVPGALFDAAVAIADCGIGSLTQR